MATLAKVVAYKDETADSLLKRFKQQVKKEDIIYEWKRREHYMSPALARKMKSERAQKLRKMKSKKPRNY
jgi:small subunit ribosomal protein S21